MAKLKENHVYQLKVWLQGISSMIWRRLLVRSDSTIADLHHTIQIAIGWSDIHLNLFHIHGQDYGVYHNGGISFADNPEQMLLSAFGFRTRERFFYEYDFGDAWLHEIRIEKHLPLDPKRIYPVCIDAKHAPPPEDCGGAVAYLQIRQELKYRALFGGNGINDDFDDETDPEDEWLEEDRPVDPDYFSRREVVARLREHAKPGEAMTEISVDALIKHLANHKK